MPDARRDAAADDAAGGAKRRRVHAPSAAGGAAMAAAGGLPERLLAWVEEQLHAVAVEARVGRWGGASAQLLRGN
jgi:hypothetical protein